MVDRDKVIKGIDICLEGFLCSADCPYYPHDTKTVCMKQLRDDALELLKEQEPVPPRKVRRYIDYSDTGINCPVTYDCGICGNELPENAKYCPECGKAVK